MPVKVESTPMLPGLSPVGGKAIVARFDAACMSSDGGLLALREVEQRLALASRLAACVHDPRNPSRVVHGLDEIIRMRMLMIAAGYEDGNDADRLRRDPMFKLAMNRLPDDSDTRFIVTNLNRPSGRTVYEDIYCARGQAENHIKAWKTHLAADRTSCCRASANQMRLFLHVGAYWLMWSLRTLMPRRSRWRVAQFDTLRLRLIKLAVSIKVLKTQVSLHLPRATPDQALFALLLTRMPRLSL